MTTPILGLDELAASQSQPHVPVNASFRALEVFGVMVRVSDRHVVDPPASPSEGDRYLLASGPLTGEWAGQDNKVAYYSGGWNFLTPQTGWLAYVADEDTYFQYVGGSPTGWEFWSEGVTGPATEYPYDIGAQLAGAPTASLVMLRFKFPRQVTFPESLTNSQGTAGTAATAQTDFDIQKNGASVGTMRFAAAGTAATFIMASAQTFTPGDVLTVVAPGSPDATLAGVSFTLAGSREA